MKEFFMLDPMVLLILLTGVCVRRNEQKMSRNIRPSVASNCCARFGFKPICQAHKVILLVSIPAHRFETTPGTAV